MRAECRPACGPAAQPMALAMTLGFGDGALSHGRRSHSYTPVCFVRRVTSEMYRLHESDVTAHG